VEDVSRTNAVVADMRKIIRQDPRIIQKLHRRVFLDKLTREQARPALTGAAEARRRAARAGRCVLRGRLSPSCTRSLRPADGMCVVGVLT